MTETPTTPAPVCSECGTPPGGEVMPRRWVWIRRFAILTVLLAWTISVVVAYARSTAWSAGYAGAWKHVYPCQIVDVWLDQASTTDPDDDWWVRRVITASWSAQRPLPRDATLELAIVQNSVATNITPWTPSTLTPGDLVSPDTTDGRFLRLARSEIARVLGKDWDTTGQTTVAWRAFVPDDVGLTGTTRHVPSNVGPWIMVQVHTLDDPSSIGRDMVWSAPRVRARGGWVSVRFGPNAHGRSRVIEFSQLYAGLALVQLIVLTALAWVLVPPIWWRLARLRRSRGGRCLRCGYPLATPPPTAPSTQHRSGEPPRPSTAPPGGPPPPTIADG